MPSMESSTILSLFIRNHHPAYLDFRNRGCRQCHTSSLIPLFFLRNFSIPPHVWSPPCPRVIPPPRSLLICVRLALSRGLTGNAFGVTLSLALWIINSEWNDATSFLCLRPFLVIAVTPYQNVFCAHVYAPCPSSYPDPMVMPKSVTDIRDFSPSA